MNGRDGFGTRDGIAVGPRPRLKLVPGGRPGLETPRPRSLAPLRTLALASGKGGVGKTSLAVNLALALADLRQRVLVVDGDLGLGKLDLLIGATPTLHLGHVLAGECDILDAVITGPRGVRFLPGACGEGSLAVLDPLRRRRLLESLDRFRGAVDLVILDLATGIGPNALELARGADEVGVVTTPEPTAYADAYALIKLLSGRGSLPPRIVVNRTRDEEEGRETFLRISTTAKRHLGVSPTFWGAIPEDAAVQDAVRGQLPFTLSAPDAPASRHVRELAWRIVRGRHPDGGNRVPAAGFAPSPAAPGSLRRSAAAGGPPLPEAA